MLHSLVDLACFTAILQQVVGAPFARFRVAEHVMFARLHQLLGWGQCASPLAFLASIVAVDAVAASVVLSWVGLATLITAAAELVTLIVLVIDVACFITGGLISHRY